MVDIQRDTTMQRILELTEKNNTLLKKMHRSQQWAAIFRVLHWLIVVGLLAGSFYFLQPFINQAVEVYQKLLNTSESLQGIGNHVPDFTGFFEGTETE